MLGAALLEASLLGASLLGASLLEASLLEASLLGATLCLARLGILSCWTLATVGRAAWIGFLGSSLNIPPCVFYKRGNDRNTD